MHRAAIVQPDEAQAPCPDVRSTPLQGNDRGGTGLHSTPCGGQDVASTWGAVDFSWRWLLFAFLLWWAMLRRWEANGTLDRWNASRALGFVLIEMLQHIRHCPANRLFMELADLS